MYTLSKAKIVPINDFLRFIFFINENKALLIGTDRGGYEGLMAEGRNFPFSGIMEADILKIVTNYRALSFFSRFPEKVRKTGIRIAAL